MKKKYIVGIALITLLAGCGTSPVQSEYEKKEAVETNDMIGFAVGLVKNGYEAQSDINLGRGSGSITISHEQEDEDLHYTNSSPMVKKLLQAYKNNKFRDYRPNQGEADELDDESEDKSDDVTYIEFSGVYGNNMDEISLQFCSELEKEGIKGIEKSYEKAKRNKRFVFIQDGILFSRGDDDLMTVSFQPNEGCKKAWKEYVLKNVVDGFVVSSSTQGGIYDRLLLLGSQEEADCKYSKVMKIYAKDKKQAYMYLDFYTNDSGNAIFMDKEKETVKNVLASFGASTEMIEKFLTSCTPSADGEVNLGGCKGTWSSIDGGYRLTVQ